MALRALAPRPRERAEGGKTKEGCVPCCLFRSLSAQGALLWSVLEHDGVAARLSPLNDVGHFLFQHTDSYYEWIG